MIANIRNTSNPIKKQFAKQMRANPTPSEREFRKLAGGRKLGFRFKIQSVIRGWIVDFYCPVLKVVVELDGALHDFSQNERKDKAFQELGLEVWRYPSRNVFAVGFAEALESRMIARATLVMQSTTSADMRYIADRIKFCA